MTQMRIVDQESAGSFLSVFFHYFGKTLKIKSDGE